MEGGALPTDGKDTIEGTNESGVKTTTETKNSEWNRVGSLGVEAALEAVNCQAQSGQSS